MIAGERCRLRPHRRQDAAQLSAAAGAFAVARWMTARFPHPYGLVEAQAWLAVAAAEDPVDHFAIEVDGTLAGGAGLQPASGERFGVAEFGYWLGCDYWGRGIATEAARLLARHAFAQRGLHRLEAHVFAPNAGSMRVLEKTGFRCEGKLRSGFVERDGTIVDGFLYGRLAADPAP